MRQTNARSIISTCHHTGSVHVHRAICSVCLVIRIFRWEWKMIDEKNIELKLNQKFMEDLAVFFFFIEHLYHILLLLFILFACLFFSILLFYFASLLLSRSCTNQFECVGCVSTLYTRVVCGVRKLYSQCLLTCVQFDLMIQVWSEKGNWKRHNSNIFHMM